MYVITKNCPPEKFLTLLEESFLPISRFKILPGDARGSHSPGVVIGAWPRVNKGERCLKIKGIRLKRKKPNCGQHAGPCRLTGKKHRTVSYLEGADWVGFNDMLNDLCDMHSIEADIYTNGLEQTGKLFIRIGKRRRDRYNGFEGGPFWDANYDPNDYTATNFGKQTYAPRSDFDAGTPGLAAWLRIEEDLHPELFEEHDHDEEEAKTKVVA